jgi:hypothetical protein
MRVVVSNRSVNCESRLCEAGPSSPRAAMKTPSDEPPDGRLVWESLPPPNTTRWVVRRKAAVVAAVRTGAITMEEACGVYQLSEEELISWERAFEAYGLAGLRTTRIQQYRRSRHRASRSARIPLRATERAD